MHRLHKRLVKLPSKKQKHMPLFLGAYFLILSYRCPIGQTFEVTNASLNGGAKLARLFAESVLGTS
jgi:hypothetical protein